MATRKQTISKILGSFQIIRRGLLQQVAERRACNQNENSVSLSQQVILLMIAARGAVSVKDIAKAQMISSSAATQAVDALVKKGYLLRSQDERDRRTTLVVLGPEYEQLVTKQVGNATAYLTPVFSSLSKEELEEYERLNHKLVSSLRKENSA
ncbi:MAG: MarR family transcriptional regulator [Gammaproteobacteria bacterium]|nr:MarR family transcriptional regulator [Gammaproteobacteria bacterium]